MSLAFSSIRVGKRYILTNFGEVSEFNVIENLGLLDFKLKDLHTLESYRLSDLIKFGKGADFSLWELQ